MMRPSTGLATLVLTVGLAWSSAAYAQQATAAAAIDRFLVLNATDQLQSAEGRDLRTGEASEWNVPATGPLPDRHDRLVAIGEGHAVARVLARPPEGDPIDLYFYLEEAEQGWRVSAMRTLALPPFVYMMIDQLEAQTSRSPDEDRILENVRLVTLTDAALRHWFDENRQAIDSLVEAYERLPSGSGAVRDDGATPGISAALAALHLTQISAAEGGIVLVIGGVLDNSVGLMRTASPPPMSPSEYIWVEPLADGWFLFRTT